MTDEQKTWYLTHIAKLDPKREYVKIDEAKNLLIYSSKLRSDETGKRGITAEELVHALIFCLLVTKYKYPVDRLYHERYFKHGSAGSLSDEVDFMIYDDDGLAYALWEIKSSADFGVKEKETIQYQLFGTAPLTGGPKYLVYATIHPVGNEPEITLRCIDNLEYTSHESWQDADSPIHTIFPIGFHDLSYEPLKNGSDNDLRTDCTQADFRTVALTFHNEFFGEHADNVLFVSLVKCLLAKIYDERMTKKGDIYQFQIFQKSGKSEKSEELFERVNHLYATAYKRFIDPNAKEIDEINPREFAPEKVKIVVKVLQTMSITKGASIHGDVIGAFFEEILRFGFKQDKGMYFTHDNIVTFMLNAVDIQGLTDQVWSEATHPDNRLPYIIDPACGSGTFLLKAMNMVTQHIKSNQTKYKTDLEAEEFFDARLSDSKPNYWAENFMYGFDPKFIMAITAKVNMVLHGDGSAHIYKYDAYKGFDSYDAKNLRVVPDRKRSLPKSKYKFDVTESFDLIVSNPPFGVTLSNETKSKLSSVFSLREALPSEAVFFERCFQLLKPNGRLALVMPESILNASDNIDVRLFLYRMFKLKCVVGLPRNIFKDTPTLTSLVFAQRKTKEEIEAWDEAWEKVEQAADVTIKAFKTYLSSAIEIEGITAAKIKKEFLSQLSPIITKKDWFLKRGKNSAVLQVDFSTESMSVADALDRCRSILGVAGFQQAKTLYCFNTVAAAFNYEFPVYMVDEIGYKLSNRKEKARPNQLCRFVGKNSKIEKPNLHLMDEDFELVIDTKNPKTILDFIKRDVTWD